MVRPRAGYMGTDEAETGFTRAQAPARRPNILQQPEPGRAPMSPTPWSGQFEGEDPLAPQLSPLEEQMAEDEPLDSELPGMGAGAPPNRGLGGTDVFGRERASNAPSQQDSLQGLLGAAEASGWVHPGRELTRDDWHDVIDYALGSPPLDETTQEELGLEGTGGDQSYGAAAAIENAYEPLGDDPNNWPYAAQPPSPLPNQADLGREGMAFVPTGTPMPESVMGYGPAGFARSGGRRPRIGQE